MSIFDSLVSVQFPPHQYFRREHPKKQIVLHHTVSGGGARGDISWWLQTATRIATCVIIDRQGVIYQCFFSKHWAHHLGVKAKVFRANGFRNTSGRNLRLNQQSIGVELDSWGGLVKGQNGQWFNAVWNRTNKRYEPGTFKVTNVQKYDPAFRGFLAFEKYTEAQLKTLKELLLYWKDIYTNIPFDYRESIWDVDKDALKGVPGIYAHVSYRPDKSDCHPQPELIAMLKQLNNGN